MGQDDDDDGHESDENADRPKVEASTKRVKGQARRVRVSGVNGKDLQCCASNFVPLIEEHLCYMMIIQHRLELGGGPVF